MRNKTTRMLAESAVLIAVATILSMLKIDLPFGGGVTIASMLPIILLSHRWGWKNGLLSAFVYSGVQLMLGLDNVGYATSFVMAVGVVMLDYIIAYTALGFSGCFDAVFGKTLKSVVVGIAATFTVRFVCHVISGAWIWGEWMPESFMNMPMTSKWVYSFLYNGWYMLAELVVTEVIAVILYRPLGRYFRREDIK